MVQKEVAERICAKAGTADYSAFTVFCNYYAEPEILFLVPPDCFIPQPKVPPPVIRLKARTAPPRNTRRRALLPCGARQLRPAAQDAGQRSECGVPQLLQAVFSQLLTDCGFSPSIRGERLDLSGFAAIANALARQNGG